jgi:uncharacterized membrane protein YuzA (DUF378 family)
MIVTTCVALGIVLARTESAIATIMFTVLGIAATAEITYLFDSNSTVRPA